MCVAFDCCSDCIAIFVHWNDTHVSISDIEEFNNYLIIIIIITTTIGDIQPVHIRYVGDIWTFIILAVYYKLIN